MAQTSEERGPGAIELMEESVHLLRGVSAGSWCIYYAGSGLFVMGFLFFWAYMSWFAPPPAVNAWAAFALSLLFVGMKGAHAVFCAHLMAHRMAVPAQPWSWRRWVHLTAVQTRSQALGLVLVAAAACLVFPLGWTYAYFQSATVMGDDENLHEKVSGQAMLWPAQNHVGLLMIAALGCMVWLNLASAVWAVPWLGRNVLGFDNLTGLSGWSLTNTTCLASVTAMAWLLTDPLVKAFYTLRVFHGRSRVTGQDLKVALKALGGASGGRAVRGALAALFIAAGSCRIGRAEAAGGSSGWALRTAPVASVVGAADLDKAADRVLSGPDFAWRLRPRRGASVEEPDGPIKGFFREGFELVRTLARSVRRLTERFSDWLGGVFSPGSARSDAREHGSRALSAHTLRLLLCVFVAAVLILIAVVLFLAIRRGRLEPGVRSHARVRPVPDAPPNLEDEASHAGQLPVDGWLQLAREQLGRGQYRLAWRALYLATLAGLSEEGLVTLAKHKTNLDYEGEVRRRAPGRPAVSERFSGRRSAFEAVWYGSAIPREDDSKAWLAEFERRGSA